MVLSHECIIRYELWTYLQYPGELGLPVRYVRRVLGRQRLDDLAERGQRQVDALALGEGHAVVRRDACYLTTVSCG